MKRTTLQKHHELRSFGRIFGLLKKRVISSSSSNNPTSKDVLQERFSSWNSAKNQAKKWRMQHPHDKIKILSVSVDRSALKQPSVYEPQKETSTSDQVEKTKENELVHILRTMIQVKGPLTVAEFMQRALSHPDHGYYMKKDVFGVKGDFTTAPEISQMFGELIGIWCVATWQQMNMPQELKIIELGPGRGSLMSDFLRAAISFPAFYQALEIHMVEISPALRKIQQQTLGCVPSSDKSQDIGSASEKMQIPGGPIIHWYEDFYKVPQGPSLMIAQELFDALPVHQFQYTERGWCERLVDIDYGEGEDHFRFVLSPGPTPAAKVYIGRQKLFDPASIIQPLNLKKSKLADEPIERLDIENNSAPIHSKGAQIRDRIEISPMGIALIQDMAKRISHHGGAALIVDYGHNHPSELSLRGIKNHEFVSVLREPGEVDLSIDVDFATLKKYATVEKDVQGTGPIGQGDFLKAMGIEHRLALLLQNCTDEEGEELFSAYERLVDPDQMGTIFKAMALTHTSIGKPVGFQPLSSTATTTTTTTTTTCE